MRNLITKLVEVEAGGLPLVVRGAKDPAGHLLIVQLVRYSDWLPPDCHKLLGGALKDHQLQIKKNSRDESDPYGCVVLKAVFL